LIRLWTLTTMLGAVSGVLKMEPFLRGKLNSSTFSV